MISVILVTFNSMNVLPGCLGSLEQCSNSKELEIVLVDNNSIDGTWEWIKAYQKKSQGCFASILTLKLLENKGYAFANNRGIGISCGDIILLLNPDTVVGHKVIEVCKEELLVNKYGAIGCRLELANGQLDKACRRSFPTVWNSFCRQSRLSVLFPKLKFLTQYNLTYLDDKEGYYVDCLCGAFLMVQRTVLLEVGGLDEDYFMYGEDIELCYRIKQLKYGIWYEGSQTTIHFKGGNGGKRSTRSLRHFYDAMIVYYDKRRSHKYISFEPDIIRAIIRLVFYVHLTIIKCKLLIHNNLK